MPGEVVAWLGGPIHPSAIPGRTHVERFEVLAEPEGFFPQPRAQSGNGLREAEFRGAVIGSRQPGGTQAVQRAEVVFRRPFETAGQRAFRGAEGGEHGLEATGGTVAAKFDDTAFELV